jgi:phosphohistidine phosphatase
MTRTLYLLRHAKSSWDDPTLPDHERPLSGRGRRACARLAAHLRTAGVAPGLVLCTSAARARETYERIAAGLPATTEVRIDAELYGASVDDLLATLRALPDPLDSVMLVGHDPGLQGLVLSLARPGPLRDDAQAKFPTGALATLSLTTSWAAVRPDTAELTSFVKPRALR